MIYKNIFDTHSHYDDEKFNADRDEVLSSLEKSGVCGVIDCGCDFDSSLRAIELSEKYDFVFAAIGIHPHEAADAGKGDLEKLKALYSKEKVVAVGEIGLDYHYDFSPRETQLEFFEKQLILANELSLPVIVHDREAHEDTLNLLKKHRPKGVVHCFSGSAEMAKELLKLGYYLSFTGVITYKNARRAEEVIRIVPDDRIMIETDSPYLAPVPNRGKRNDSRNVRFVAEKIAEIKEMPVEEVIRQTRENGKRFYGI